MDLPATVAPFILRGVTLAGIDSVMCPRDERLVAWQRLASDLDLDKLGLISNEIGLGEVVETASAAARRAGARAGGRGCECLNACDSPGGLDLGPPARPEAMS